ncbi:MAG: cadherin domain-containing protein [Pirellula sp.]
MRLRKRVRQALDKLRRNRGLSARRRLSVESLEDRRVLAAYISEVQYSPLFGNNDIDQYVELRGEPNGQIPNGTYFATIESWGAYPGGPGYIHSLIDVSNLTFGSNGFLTILEAGNTYQVDPASTKLVGTGVAFSGLPNNRWTDASTISDRLAHVSSSLSFLLIQTTIKPIVGSDIDVDDNGVLDGPAATWTVHDAVAMMGYTPTPGWSYGRITYSELTTNHNYAAGTFYTVQERCGYVARIGNSTGYALEDWVCGGTVEDKVTPNSKYRFSYGTFGDPRPLVYSGRSVNHIGTYNFGGGYLGFAGMDSNGDGQLTTNETPLPGVTLFADMNDNGVRDSKVVDVIAAQQVLGAELANVFPNATLTVADSNGKNIGFAVRTRETFDPVFNKIRVLSSEGIPWFDTGSKLKVMFYREADAVSIEAIAAETLKASFGRMELYDRNNNLLEYRQTAPLLGTDREVLSVIRPQADIKYAIIYTNDKVTDSSPFGPFDKLRYTYPEYQEVTDATGAVRLEGLHAGDYKLLVSSYPGDKIPLDTNSAYPLSVTKSEHRVDPMFGYRQDQLPEIQTTQLLIPENPATNAVVGVVAASDPDPGQTLSFRFVGPSGPFSIDGLTGEVRFNNTSKWDYETMSPLAVDVEVADSLPIPGKTVKTLTLIPIDVNEAPVIQGATFSIPENSEKGTVVGSIVASDEDAGINGEIRYSLGFTNPIGVFAIDAISGMLSVNNSSGLDYESKPTIVVPVVVNDRATPSLSSTRSITVQVTDVNEAPSNVTFSNVVSVPENTSMVNAVTVATIVIVDDGLGNNTLSLSGPDASSFSIVNQQLRFRSATPLDFETKSTFSVIVSADDPTLGATPDVSVTFNLQITDVNEKPTGLQFNNVVNPLPETTVVSTAVRVANIQVTDDALGNNVLSLANSLDSANFSIVGTELRFRSVTPLDFETKSLYRVVVQVDDASFSGFPDASQTFSLSIGDVNEPPTEVRLTNAVTLIQETNGVSSGQTVATISIIDDALGTNQVSLVGNDASSFEVVGNQLNLKAGALLNYEVKPSYSVIVRANDPTIAGSTPVERSLNLNIGNRPEVVSLTDLQGNPLASPISRARLTWDMELATVAFDAISVRKKDVGNVAVSYTSTKSLVGNRTVVDLEFTGAYVGPNGLVDGVYEILVNGAKTTAIGTGTTGISYSSGDFANLNPLPVGSLAIAGPGLLRAGRPGTYQLAVTGLPDPQPQSIEYAVDFQGDGVVDRTVTGGATYTLENVSYATADAYTMVVTAKSNSGVVAKSAFVVNVTPATNVGENWLSALDADRDLTISPLDPLVIINRINGASGGVIPYTLDYDVDRDGSVSPLDVLAVINFLNTPLGSRVEQFADLVMAESGGLPAITSDRSITGKILSSSRSLYATLNGGAKIDASQYVANDGTFSINDAAIAQLFGAIPDGPQMISLMTKTSQTYSAAVDKRYLNLTNHLKAFSFQSLVVDQGKLRVGWSSSAMGANYNIWLGPAGGTLAKVRSDLAGTLETLPVTSGVYQIQIEAIDGAGSSLKSEIATITVA